MTEKELAEVVVDSLYDEVYIAMSEGRVSAAVVELKQPQLVSQMKVAANKVIDLVKKAYEKSPGLDKDKMIELIKLHGARIGRSIVDEVTCNPGKREWLH